MGQGASEANGAWWVAEGKLGIVQWEALLKQRAATGRGRGPRKSARKAQYYDFLKTTAAKATEAAAGVKTANEKLSPGFDYISRV